jgi:AcrR family transcriptional regulator
VIASQRTRLQRAAVEIAARDGLDKVTIRRLTKLARVSTGVFYAQFSGTNDCLMVTYREIMAESARRMGKTRSADLDAGDQVDRTLRAFLKYLLADPQVASFALIEIYAGGPAALEEIAEQDRRLAKVLCGCLDRRSTRTAITVATSIVAAALHCARTRLLGTSPQESSIAVDGLVEWARGIVAGKESLAISYSTSQETAAADLAHSGPEDRDEEELILAAVLRLASPDGYYSLTPSKVSSAAGLPAARFRRHFANLADGYVAAIRRTCRVFFFELTATAEQGTASRLSIRLALLTASRRATSDPAGARLTFRQVIDAGVAGVTCRDSLISELALACGAAEPPAAQNRPIRAEASIAALWATLAMSSRAG